MNDEIKPGYTRISNILSPYTSYDEIPEHVLAKAAARGTAIHKLCELYAKDGIHMPSEYDGYVEGFVKWFDREVREVHQLETRLYCDTYEITGQYDMYIQLKGGEDYIVDIKTCAGKHDTWPLQLSAYQYLYEEYSEGFSPRKAVLHLKKDGRYEFIVYADEQRDRQLFKSALQLHRYFKKG